LSEVCGSFGPSAPKQNPALLGEDAAHHQAGGILTQEQAVKIGVLVRRGMKVKPPNLD
jgi:hypothetical protein